jgi:GNAT superfamily N-acetyltransferase
MSDNIVIEPATEADLDELSQLLGELFAQESDFCPDKDKQLRGLRLIFEQPSRGRVFVLRRDGAIVGMINLLFTISTAEGGFVMLLEDLVIHKKYQGHGYGAKLLNHAIDFAKKKNFLRITLLTDRPENLAQEFFRRHGFVESSMIPMRLWLQSQPDTDDEDA